jgi:tRNA (adenine22-N1)-methyltransferase
MSKPVNQLSKRLLAIAKLVDNNSVVVDVGSDHGLLIKYLIDEKIIAKGYATENKIGPFTLLNSSLSSYHNIHCYMADGLDKLPNDVDTIIIAGMGGNLINDILKRAINSLKTIKILILAPNNNVYLMRKYMHHCQFKIDEEVMVFDRDQYYEISKWSHGFIQYTDDDYNFGPLLRKDKSTVFIDRWKRRSEEINRLLIRPLPKQKMNKLVNELERIEKL